MANKPTPQIRIGDRIISRDGPCYIIAEVGVNHNGDLAIAKRMVAAAAQAGADAVKFQTFRAEAMVLPGAAKAKYQEQHTGAGTQGEMLASLELSPSNFRELRDECQRFGVDFLSTAFDSESLSDVLALEPKAIKWPSGEIDNISFMREAAASGLPVILSTGMADLVEIDAAVAALNSAGAAGVAILQCVSQYPAPMDEQNLMVIPALANRFGCVTGYSDHTDTLWASVAARALGMAILEKHLTLDRDMPGPDHKASIEPESFAQMVRAVREIEAALGDGVKRPMPSELSTRTVARKSLVYADALPAGTVLQERHLNAMRPGTGLSPVRSAELMDRVLRRDVSKLDYVSLADFT